MSAALKNAVKARRPLCSIVGRSAPNGNGFLRGVHAASRTSLVAGSESLRLCYSGHTFLQSNAFHNFSRNPTRVPAASTQLNSGPNLNPKSPTNGDAQQQQQQQQQQALRQLGIVNGKVRAAPVRRRNPRRRKQSHAQTDPLPNERIRVKSVHAAATLDVVSVLSKVFGKASSPPNRHMFGKNSVIVQLPQLDGSEYSRFVAVFRFGSVVFFNVSPREAGRMLEAIKKHGTEPVASGFERKEHFEVVVSPHVDDSEPAVNGDYCRVDSLDMNSVSIISNVMAQTVALDSYSDIVDELLTNFASINAIVTRTGNFTEMEKTSLFQVVAQNNSIFIDMISKLGIKDRSDTAWNLSQYDQVHQGLKEEFEIEDRFDNIEVKLETISQNAKFFLEILHNQKSNTLEWIIIVLISFECILMVMEMTGAGTSLFASIPALSTFPKG